MRDWRTELAEQIYSYMIDNPSEDYGDPNTFTRRAEGKIIRAATAMADLCQMSDMFWDAVVDPYEFAQMAAGEILLGRYNDAKECMESARQDAICEVIMLEEMPPDGVA